MTGVRLRLVFLASLLCACGRLGYHSLDTGMGDAPLDTGMGDVPLDTGMGDVPDGMVARYRLDEAEAGEEVMVLRDSTPNPVDLQLTYLDGSPAWASGEGGRYLSFDDRMGGQRGATALIAGTELEGLHGLTEATFETKLQWLSCTDSDARLFELTDGEMFESGYLSVREDLGAEVFAVLLQGNAIWSMFSYDVGGSGCLTDAPHVLHWVLQTQAPVAGDRVRAYVDGERVTVVSTRGDELFAGARVDLGPLERRATLGRPHTGTRLNRSRIWYVAVFDRALSEGEIAVRAPALLADDDGY